jgi:hypothetical protein
MDIIPLFLFLAPVMEWITFKNAIAGDISAILHFAIPASGLLLLVCMFPSKLPSSMAFLVTACISYVTLLAEPLIVATIDPAISMPRLMTYHETVTNIWVLAIWFAMMHAAIICTVFEALRALLSSIRSRA